MSADVFIAVCQDRHHDLVVKVFTEPERAVDYARTFLREHVAHPDKIEEETDTNGWLYYATYKLESDYAYAIKGTLDEPA